MEKQWSVEYDSWVVVADFSKHSAADIIAKCCECSATLKIDGEDKYLTMTEQNSWLSLHPRSEIELMRVCKGT